MRSVFLLLCSAAVLSAADPLKDAPKPLPRAAGGIGTRIPDADFTDLAGKKAKLSDYAKAPLLVVAVTVTNQSCPLSKKFAPVLAQIEKDYRKKNVAFLFINPTENDTPRDAFASSIVIDKDGKLARLLGMKSTTEVVVLDSARTVKYRGAVSDQHGLGYSLDAPRKAYLTLALDALLAGQTPDFAATTAPGCPLDLEPAKVSVSHTYHNRISRIIQQNCQECHREKGVAPFGLETYEEVVSQKGAIRQVIERGIMPPWFAEQGKDNDRPHFLNDRSLSAKDKTDLLAWLKSDLPRGDSADAPLPKKWPEEWAIGKPDAIFQIGKPISIPATGTMPYQNVTVDTNLTEDKWVEAFEIKPTSPGVVHHVLVHVIPKFGLGRLAPGGRQAVNTNVDDERNGFFAAYVPGNDHLVLGKGFARRLPKNSTLRFQIHYTPNGQATTDQVRLGLKYAKEEPTSVVKVGAVMKPDIRIPAGASNHEEVAKLKVPVDLTIRALMPHMHVRGKACRYELISPDGKASSMLLDIPHYDFNWQLRYQFAEPVTIPKGSTIRFTVWYDNSANNPANPDPKRMVRWGPQTSDEMHLGYVEYVIDRTQDEDEPFKSDEKPKIPKEGIDIPERFKKGLSLFDKNGDGKLDEKEIDAMPEQIRGRVWDYIRKTRD